MLHGNILPNVGYKRTHHRMNIYTNDGFISRLSEPRYVKLYDDLDMKNNPCIVDTLFNILSVGTRGDLYVEEAEESNRQIIYCKLEVDKDGIWDFEFRNKHFLKKHLDYEGLKSFIKDFVSMTTFEHLHEEDKTCIYFSYELIPNEAIIFLD